MDTAERFLSNAEASFNDLAAQLHAARDWWSLLELIS